MQLVRTSQPVSLAFVIFDSKSSNHYLEILTENIRFRKKDAYSWLIHHKNTSKCIWSRFTEELDNFIQKTMDYQNELSKDGPSQLLKNLLMIPDNMTSSEMQTPSFGSISPEKTNESQIDEPVLKSEFFENGVILANKPQSMVGRGQIRSALVSLAHNDEFLDLVTRVANQTL